MRRLATVLALLAGAACIDPESLANDWCSRHPRPDCDGGLAGGGAGGSGGGTGGGGGGGGGAADAGDAGFDGGADDGGQPINLIGAWNVGGPGATLITDVHVNGSEVYAVGQFTGPWAVGGVNAGYDAGAFAVAYTLDGGLLWVKAFGPGPVRLNAVSFAGGNVVVGGTLLPTGRLDAPVMGLSTAGQGDAIVVLLDGAMGLPNGQQRLVATNNQGRSEVQDLVARPAAQLGVVGTYEGAVGAINGAGAATGTDTFYLRWDSKLAPQAANALIPAASPGGLCAASSAADRGGELFVIGVEQGCRIVGQPGIGDGGLNRFIARAPADGGFDRYVEHGPKRSLSPEGIAAPGDVFAAVSGFLTVPQLGAVGDGGAAVLSVLDGGNLAPKQVSTTFGPGNYFAAAYDGANVWAVGNSGPYALITTQSASPLGQPGQRFYGPASATAVGAANGVAAIAGTQRAPLRIGGVILAPPQVDAGTASAWIIVATP